MSERYKGNTDLNDKLKIVQRQSKKIAQLVDQVHDLIHAVAIENPHVLNEPTPLVTLEEFGDSALNFTLRCCITAIEKRFVIVHQLNKSINDELIKAKISIPFPQREVRMLDEQD